MIWTRKILRSALIRVRGRRDGDSAPRVFPQGHAEDGASGECGVAAAAGARSADPDRGGRSPPDREAAAALPTRLRKAAGCQARAQERDHRLLRDGDEVRRGGDHPRTQDRDLGLRGHDPRPDDRGREGTKRRRAPQERDRRHEPQAHLGAPARQRLLAPVRRLRQRHHRAGRVQGLPLPERAGREDALVPRPRRPRHLP